MDETSGRPLVCRGIRGATTAQNTKESILEATRDLLTQIAQANELDTQDVASVFFTTTTDLDAEYPALAARQLGWVDVALMCGHEMSVPGSLKSCIRVLIHWNTTRRNSEIKHVYTRGAEILRPDLSMRKLVQEQGSEQQVNQPSAQVFENRFKS